MKKLPCAVAFSNLVVSKIYVVTEFVQTKTSEI